MRHKAASPYCWISDKKYRSWSDIIFHDILSGSTLFAQACLSKYLTISAQLTKADITANSVAPDETAHNESSHQKPHCLPFCSWFPTVTFLAAVYVSKCWDERFYFRNSGLKRFWQQYVTKEIWKYSLKITFETVCNKWDLSQLWLSWFRLAWITAYLEVKIWFLISTGGNKIFRSNFSYFPQYFQYIFNFRSQITYSWLSLSQPRLSRITAYLEVKLWSLPKHENPTTGKTNIVEKRRNCS